MKRVLTLLSILLLSTFALMAQQNELIKADGKVNIKLKFANIDQNTPQKLTHSFSSFDGYQVNELESHNGEFNFLTDINYYRIENIYTDNHSFELVFLTAPYTEIDIIVHSSDSVVFSGDWADVNNSLQKFKPSPLNYIFSKLNMPDFSTYEDALVFRKDTEELTLKIRSEIDSICSEWAMSRTVRDIMYSINDEAQIEQLLFMAVMKPEAKNVDKIFEPTPALNYNSDYIITRDFATLQVPLMYNIVKDGEDISIEEFALKLIDEGERMIENQTVREIAIVAVLLEMWKKEMTTFSDATLNRLRNAIKNDYLYSILLSHNEEFKNFDEQIGVDKIQLLDIDSDSAINFDIIKDKFKGKVVYVDIWATWCSPCMFEIEYSADFFKELGEVKDKVTFLYISCTSSDKTWIKTILDNKLDSKNSYHLKFDKAQSDQLFKSLGNRFLPQYYIIDKKGDVVEAPRPSEGSKVKKMLVDRLQ